MEQRKDGAAMESNFYDKVADYIKNSDKTENEKNELLEKLETLKKIRVNILLAGATGCGKSSTINALFETQKAKVGAGADPETKELAPMQWGDSLFIYDSPGLGDSPEHDEQLLADIKKKLAEKDGDGRCVMDMVLVILNGSSKDLAVSYHLIEEISQVLGGKEERQRRILVAVNQADQVLKGRHWNAETSEPDEILKERLKETVASVRKRILDGTAQKNAEGEIIEGTGLEVTPICYSAGYMDPETGIQEKPYNLNALLTALLCRLPEEKRSAVVSALNQDLFDDNPYAFNEERMLSRTAKSLYEFGQGIVTKIGDEGFDSITLAGDMVNEHGIAAIPFGLFELGHVLLTLPVMAAGGAFIYAGTRLEDLDYKLSRKTEDSRYVHS
ncbi:MAG: 50S ribosome-binding GTPase [bacterium]|nr:50S ribosome-binding GTPase [bacterium]